jgi:hypothetical protein
LGGIFATDGIKFHLTRQGTQPPYIEDYYLNVLKRNECPAPPSFGDAVSMRFHDKSRNQVLDFCNEAIKARRWTEKIVTESMKRAMPSAAAMPQQDTGKVYGGLAAIQKRKEAQTAYTGEQITGAFQDLASLKEKSRQMV